MNTIIKRIKRIMFLAMTVFYLSCAGYLDIVPDNTKTLEDIFSVREEAYNALSKIYSYLPRDHDTHLTTWTLGDEYVGRLDYDADRFQLYAIRIMRGLQAVSSDYNLLGSWSGRGGARPLYEGIRQTNVFIENIDKVVDMSDAEKVDWKAQGKFLKAYYTFLLLQKYGPVVISDKVVNPDAKPEDLFVFRSKVEDCFDYIIKLIDEAIPQLTERAASNELGRIDRIGATAIKARIMLFRASDFYNGNVEYFGDFLDFDGKPFFPMTKDKEKWKAAVDAIDDAIQIALANGKDLYVYEKEPYLDDREDLALNYDKMKTLYDLRMLLVDPWNKELLWGNSNINFAGDGGLAQATNMRLPYTIPGGQTNVTSYSWQWLSATYKMVERYYTENGLPIFEDRTFDRARMYETVFTPGVDEPEYIPLMGYLQPGYEIVRIYTNREPRFYANLGITGGYWRGHQTRISTEMYSGKYGGKSHETDFYCTGIGIQKFVHPESTSGNWTRQIRYPYPIIRMADLYLMKAEALNEYLDAPNEEVWAAINKVRSRAGIPSVQESWANPAKVVPSSLNKHTKKEDMRDIILQERGIELAFEGSRFWDMLRHRRAPAEFSTPVWGWTETGLNAQEFFVLNVKHARKFTITDCLWPIDLNELNTNANLKQNPGW